MTEPLFAIVDDRPDPLPPGAIRVQTISTDPDDTTRPRRAVLVPITATGEILGCPIYIAGNSTDKPKAVAELVRVFTEARPIDPDDLARDDHA